jgi:hypothetical protein
MEKNIKETIERIEAKFGIDLQSILKDETLSIDEKKEQFYKILLSAKLSSIIKANKAKTMSPDFDVENYVSTSNPFAPEGALSAENRGGESPFTRLPLFSITQDEAR